MSSKLILTVTDLVGNSTSYAMKMNQPFSFLMNKYWSAHGIEPEEKEGQEANQAIRRQTRFFFVQYAIFFKLSRYFLNDAYYLK